jgi:hypothetical protein
MKYKIRKIDDKKYVIDTIDKGGWKTENWQEASSREEAKAIIKEHKELIGG